MGDFHALAIGCESIGSVAIFLIPIANVNALVGGYRMYAETKSSSKYDKYLAEARSVLQRYGEAAPPSPFSLRWRDRVRQRFPFLAPYVAEKTLHVEMNPHTEACRVYYRYLV